MSVLNNSIPYEGLSNSITHYISVLKNILISNFGYVSPLFCGSSIGKKCYQPAKILSAAHQIEEMCVTYYFADFFLCHIDKTISEKEDREKYVGLNWVFQN